MSALKTIKPGQLLACLFLLIFQGLRANLTPVKLSIRMDNSVSTVTVGTSTATHSLQLTAPSGTQKDSLVTGIVRLGVDHNSTQFVTPYNADLTVDVTTWDVAGTSTLHTYTLSVRFQPYGNVAYKAEDIKMFANQASKVYKIQSTVTSMKINGVTATNFPNNLYLESRIEYVRYSNFSSSWSSGAITPTITPIDIDCNGSSESMQVAWNQVTGAVEYQLEWAFVNDYDESGLMSAKSSSVIGIDFKNNSTRITTTGSSFVVPVIADRGYFVTRVRGVGRDLNALANPVFGEWTPNFEKGTVSTYTAATHAAWEQITTHFEVNKNWQYNVTYAEEAKHKDVISYYDGSLRNRQSITQISTDTTTIIGETIYDFNGRPAITVLPAPLAHHTCSFSPIYNPAYSFNYISNFNQADSSGIGHAYAKRDFDVISTSSSCSTTAMPMITTSGASNYYSPNNPEQNNQQAFLPDAQQYPFSQVEYTPDNTGRIRRQGGVGVNHQLETGHETKYFYGTPDQLQLDRLFGSEVGDASHYKKNMVMDANGQISVTYVDMSGKTIATALAGDVPSNVSGIPSQAAATTTLTSDLFNKDASGNSLINRPNLLPDAIEFNSTIMVASQSVNTFTYNFSVDTLGDPCLKTSVCFHCVYDLEIRVTDDCGTQLYPTSGSPVKTAGTFTTVGGNVQFLTSCSVTSYAYPSETFSMSLSPGTYHVIKTLTVDKDARDFYLAAYLSKDYNSCIKDTNDFIDAELAGLDTTDCFISCASCFQSLGTKDDFVAQGRGTELQWESLYEACGELCGNAKTNCEIAYEQMQADMSPGGQYGQVTDNGVIHSASFPLSVFNCGNSLPKNLLPLSLFSGGLIQVPANGASWKHPHAVVAANTYTYYFDSDGQRSTIPVSIQPGSTWPGGYNLQVDDVSLVLTDASTGAYYTYPENLTRLEDFVANWNPNWAKSLVYYHPEYCYYQDCIGLQTKQCGDTLSSEDFDRKLLMCNSYNDAVTRQLIVSSGGVNNLNIAMDPFVSCAATYGTDATALSTAYSNYNNAWGSYLSMAQFAASLVHCGQQYGQDPSTISHCTEFGYLVPGPSRVQDSIRDQEWNSLKSMYLGKKAEIQAKRSDASRLAFGSTCTLYNGCIGNKDYNPLEAGMMVYAFTGGVPPFHLDVANCQYFEAQQPCNIVLKDLYKDKQKRFGAAADQKGIDGNDAGYQVYAETGQCPNAFDLQGLIGGMAAAGKLTATGEDLVNHPQFTPNLYYYFCGTPNPAYYMNYDWNATAGTNLDVNFYQVASATNVKTLHLDVPSARSLDWSKVIGASQLQVTSTSGGTSYFTITLRHHDNPGDAISNINTTGSTSIILDDCKFKDACTANDFAKDLQMLMTALKTTPDNATPDLLSTTAVNLSSSSTYSILLTPALTNVIGTPTTTPQYMWKKSGASSYQLYDAHNTCTITLISGAVTPTALPSSAFNNIASFRNITSDYQNFCNVDGYSAGGNYIETIRLTVIKSCGSGTIGITMGTCAPPVPLACQTPENDTRTDLENLLTDIVGTQKFVPAASSAISDVKASTLFTDRLRSYVSTMPSSIVATTYTVNTHSYIKNFPQIHDTITGTLVNNDSLVIPFNGVDSLCTLVLQTNNAPYKTQLRLADVVSIKNLTAYGPTNNNGNFTQFYMVADFNTGSGLVTDTVFGSSCLELQNCNMCGDTTNCCGTPPMEGRMMLAKMSPQAADAQAIAAGAAQLSPDVQEYRAYLLALAELNANLGYVPADSGYVQAAGLGNFYDEGSNRYKGLAAYRRFVMHFRPELDDITFLRSTPAYLLVFGDDISPVMEYKRYTKAVANYNQRAITAQVDTVVPVSSSSFYRSHMADSIYLTIDTLMGKATAQRSASLNGGGSSSRMSMARMSYADSCDLAYTYYLDAYTAFLNYQDSLGIGACDTVQFYSETDFQDMGYCQFCHFDEFFNYNSIFYNHLACGDTIHMLTECDSLMNCVAIYDTCVARYTQYNNSTYAVTNSIYLDKTVLTNNRDLFLDGTQFGSLGYCACLQAYLDYLSAYTVAPADTAAPPPVNIDKFGPCGLKYVDPCLTAYDEYSKNVAAYNNYASTHTGYTMISTIYNENQFTASGYCYCTHNYATFLQAATKGIITDTVYIRENLSIDVYCQPDTLTCKHPHNSDTLLSPPANPEINPCVQYKRDLAKANGLLKYQQYADSVTTAFVAEYNQHCLGAVESFTRKYAEAEYHYTLYYYDQAGNLVRTIPPEGVDQSFYASITSTASPNEVAIKQDRLNGTHKVLTDHGMATTYLYNSLNQLVRQNLPDHDPMSYTRYSYSWGLDTALQVVTSQFPSSNKGYMAGNVAVPSGTNVYFSALTRGMTYQTTDGGLNWQLVPGTTGAGIRKAQFVTSSSSSYTVGFAVGTDGTFMVSYDKGLSWDLVPIHTNAQNQNFTDLSFNAVSSSDKINGVLVGEHGTSIKVQLNASATPTLTNLSGLTSNDSITSITSLPGASNAVDYFIATHNTSTGHTALYKGNSSAIASLTSWSSFSAARADNLYKVFQVPGTYKYIAGGKDGALYKYDNTDALWYRILTGTKADFKDLYFIDETNGVAILDGAGISGDLYKTTNGGLSWSLLDGGNNNSDKYTSLNGYIKASVSGSFSTDKLIATGEGGLVKRVTIIKNTTDNSCQFGAVSANIATNNTINGAMVLPYNGGTQYYALAGGNSGTLYASSDFSQNTVTWDAISAPGLNIKEILFDIKSPATMSSSTKINGVLIETDGTLSRIVSSSLTATPVTYTVGSILQGTGSYTFTDMRTLESPVTPGSINSVYMLGDNGTNSKVAVLDLGTALVSTSAPADISGGQISSVTGFNSLAMRTGDDAVIAGNAGSIYSNRGNTLPTAFGSWTNESAKASMSKINDLTIAGASGSASLIAVGDQGFVGVRDLSAGTYMQIKSTGILSHLNAVKSYSTASGNTYGAIAGSGGFVATFTNTAGSNSLSSLAIASPVSSNYNDLIVNLGANQAFVAGDNGKAISIGTFTTSPAATLINTNTTVSLRGLVLMPGTNNALALGDNMQNFVLSASAALKQKRWFVNEITKLHFTNALNGYLVGKQGLIRHTTDGGNTWSTAKPFYTASNTVTNYYLVYTTASDQAWIGGDNRYLAPLSNLTVGTAFTYSLGATQVFRDMDMNASGIGYAVGTNTTNSRAVVAQTTNHAASFTMMTVPTTMLGSRAVHVFADGSFISVGTNKAVFRYSYGASTFSLVTQPTPGSGTTYNDVYFHDDKVGYIAGDNGYVFSTADYSNSSATATWNTVSIADSWLSSGNAPNVSMKTIAFYNRYDGFMGGSYGGTNKYARNFHDESSLFSTFFWYDRLGRMVVSQNTKQRHKLPMAYSYTRYDVLGRISEVGEKADTSKTFEGIFGTYINTVYNAGAIDDARLSAWIKGAGSRTEVTKTYYDNQTVLNTALLVQQNLRKRVASSTYEDYYDGIDTTYNTASHYSYDIHGNVSVLLQENRTLVYADSVPSGNPKITLHKRHPLSTYAAQRYKRLDYDYDLISGKVNLVAYQAGKPDAFYHRYSYDADNRITRVETSRQGAVWEQDADYAYYKHGPLARTEIGQDKVQGMDYAYTIQGWMKGVNSNALDIMLDMGRDGESGKVRGLIGRDAMGYTLRYFSGDYAAINSYKWAAVTDRFEADADPDILALRQDLYNGNIGLMGTTIADASAYTSLASNFTMTPLPLAQAYQYDQLNRLTMAVATEKMVNNTWTDSKISTDLYRNGLSYDANGNILHQDKYDDGGSQLDGIDYYYNTSGALGGRLKQNRLYDVNDNISTTSYSLDVETPGFSAFSYSLGTINTANNYGYDELGNLTRDGYEEIDTMVWTAYGKLKSLTRNTGSSKNNLKFDYDAMGNRIAKHNYDNSGAWLNSTYYVRDAQGNVMTTYVNEPIAGPSVSYRASERPLYGSSRLGMDRNEVEMLGAGSLNLDSAKRVLGTKQYELSNHLGNVLTTVSDKKIPIDEDGDNALDYYIPELLTATDYYAFGQPMPGRDFTNNGSYRYGFNGKENDKETVGTGEGTQDYGMRIYNPALGRFFSIDPLYSKFAFYTPYQFAGNKPIVAIDIDGGEDRWIHSIKYPDGSVLVVRDGSDIENDITKAQNAAEFGMPQLKDGGILYTQYDINTKEHTVLSYVPDVTVKPGIMNAIKEVINHPTKPIEEALESVGGKLDELGHKMMGSMSNYGELEGDEGRQKVSKVIHRINTVGELSGGLLGRAFKINDALWTAMDIAADIENRNEKTATIATITEIAGGLIEYAVDKGTPKGTTRIDKIKEGIIGVGTKEGVGKVKDIIVDQARKQEQDEKTGTRQKNE